MNIQIITMKKLSSQNINSCSFTISSFASPYSFDDFDINVVDLSSKEIWKSYKTYDEVNSINDFLSCRRLMDNSKSSKILVVYPQNIDFRYGWVTDFSGSNDYKRSIKLKDMLPNMTDKILPSIMIPSEREVGLAFEKTKTTICAKVFESDFCFLSTQYSTLTRSDLSMKPTTVRKTSQDKYYHTALNILDSLEDLELLLLEIGLIKKKNYLPDWLNEINFLDDESQREQIIECTKVIDEQIELKENAERKLNLNTEYKRVLVDGDQDLVEVVFRVLAQIFDYDLSGFEDKKIEDFRIELKDVTLIGEIKGVNTNVKSEHVSQVERHYHMYLDELEEQGLKKEAKQILIINPMRNLPVNERKPVGQTQIDLATRNKCLIIRTEVLLKLYECYRNGSIDSIKCIELVKENSGELTFEQIQRKIQ